MIKRSFSLPKKKAISLPFILLFFLFSANISDATPVLPITKGEGIWNVVTRIASELATINLAFSPFSSSCTYTIGQSDIGFGNTFIITGSNATYCLSENVTFTFGAAITISGQSITLDLMGHAIDGLNKATGLAVGVRIAGGAHNAIIKNGIIKNIPNFGTGIGDYPAFAARIKSRPVNNILIKDIFFDNLTGGDSISFISSNFFLPVERRLLVEDCQTYNAGGISVFYADSAIVRGCVVENYSAAVDTFGITIRAPTGSSAVQMQSGIVEDCIVTGSFGINNSTIEVFGMNNTVIRNCIVYASRQGAGAFGNPASGISVRTNGGFRLKATISDCIVQYVGNTLTSDGGFLINNQFNGVLLERCIAENCFQTGFILTNNGSTQLIDCVAENCRSNGFNIGATPDTIFTRCCATACGVNGFLLTSGSGVFENCIAQRNASAGFAVSTNRVVFRDCISQRNGTDGFGITGGAFDIAFEDCIAQNNSRHGFNFVSTATQIKVSNCFSMNNTGTGFKLASNNNYAIGCMATGNAFDFAGISDPTQVIPYSTPGAINGIGRFVNVSS